MRPVLWTFKIVLWLVVLLLIVVFFILPILTSVLVNNAELLTPTNLKKYLEFADFIQIWTMRFFIVTWCFFLGSCLASFLNVVAWRLPRGQSILGSSHCPNCNFKLSFIRDNVPVVGWIRNNGQCRGCKQSIPPRYLIVELILGAAFLLISLVTLWGGGITLPLRVPNALVGFERSLYEPKWDLVQLVGYHLVLSCFLFTFALIRMERSKIPFSVVAFGLLIGFAMPLIWPSMHLANHLPSQTQPAVFAPFSADHLLTLGLGALVGALMGGMIDQFFGTSKSMPADTRSRTMTYGLALVGLYLGFQSVISVVIIWSLFRIVMRATPAWQSNLASLLFASFIVHLLSWRLGSAVGYWPSPTSSALQLGIAVALSIGLLGLHSSQPVSQAELSSEANAPKSDSSDSQVSDSQVSDSIE